MPNFAGIGHCRMIAETEARHNQGRSKKKVRMKVRMSKQDQCFLTFEVVISVTCLSGC